MRERTFNSAGSAAIARAALRDLRQSILAGRPMSLPNFLRLYRRRAALMGHSAHRAPGGREEMLRLKMLYLANQPLRRRKRLRT